MFQLKEDFDFVVDIRGIGILNAIELVKNSHAKEPDTTLAEKVMYGCLAEGLSFKVSSSNVLSLYPTLITSDEELEQAIKIIRN